VVIPFVVDSVVVGKGVVVNGLTVEVLPMVEVEVLVEEVDAFVEEAGGAEVVSLTPVKDAHTTKSKEFLEMGSFFDHFNEEHEGNRKCKLFSGMCLVLQSAVVLWRKESRNRLNKTT
jgi:hypothetical protein